MSNKFNGVKMVTPTLSKVTAITAISVVVTSCVIYRVTYNEKPQVSTFRILVYKGNGSTVPIFGKTIYHQIFYVRYLSKTTPLIEFDKDSVTIATHCSANNLHYLPALIDRWTGPISVAIISHSNEFQKTVSLIRRLADCQPEILKRVRFQFVCPLSNSHKVFPNFSRVANITCELLKKAMKKIMKKTFRSAKNYEQKTFSYPNNLMRNLARMDAQTDYALSVDIDVLPSEDLYSQTEQFIRKWGRQRNLQKTALVYPVYEVDSRSFSLIPRDKAELKSAIEEGVVRDYHIDDCPYCHAATNSTKWLSVTDGINETSAVYSVNYKSLWRPSELTTWEPFVITHKSSPLFDERFHQFGFDRISNMCELHMAGYQFLVLHPGFLIHQGFKYLSHIMPERERENQTNYRIYRNFIDQLHQKYSDSDGRCS